MVRRNILQYLFERVKKWLLFQDDGIIGISVWKARVVTNGILYLHIYIIQYRIHRNRYSQSIVFREKKNKKNHSSDPKFKEQRRHNNAQNSKAMPYHGTMLIKSNVGIGFYNVPEPENILQKCKLSNLFGSLLDNIK